MTSETSESLKLALADAFRGFKIELEEANELILKLDSTSPEIDDLDTSNELQSLPKFLALAKFTAIRAKNSGPETNEKVMPLIEESISTLFDSIADILKLPALELALGSQSTLTNVENEEWVTVFMMVKAKWDKNPTLSMGDATQPRAVRIPCPRKREKPGPKHRNSVPAQSFFKVGDYPELVNAIDKILELSSS